MLTELVLDTRIKTRQVRYDAAKEEVKTLLFSLVGEATVDIILLGEMDSLMLGNIEALTKSDSFMDALTR